MSPEKNNHSEYIRVRIGFVRELAEAEIGYGRSDPWTNRGYHHHKVTTAFEKLRLWDVIHDGDTLSEDDHATRTLELKCCQQYYNRIHREAEKKRDDV